MLQIGTLLGLPSGELRSIEVGCPTNVKWCCNQMLEKWFERKWIPRLVGRSCSKIIESSVVSSDQASFKAG